MSHPVLAIIALIAFQAFSQPPTTTGVLEIKIQAELSGQTLALGDTRYQTANGDSLYLDLLRFYLSSIQLQGRHGVYEEKDSYHLIDFEENNAPVITLKNVPPGRYDTLFFNIGTDSLINISGAMGGDLDPTLGMYWAWNTGYINIKIEGRSTSCKTRRQAFEFHIGGYQSPHQTVRKVVLPLKNVEVRENAVSTIPLRLDLGKLFSRIQLAVTNSIMIPSAEAARLADYFWECFE